MRRLDSGLRGGNHVYNVRCAKAARRNVAKFVERAWKAGARIRRTLSDTKPHAEQGTCRKPTAIEAEQAGELWGERWINRYVGA